VIRTITEPGALDRAAILRVVAGEEVALGPLGLDERRAEALAALADGRRVYGVNTGMGALAGHRLDDAAQARHQEALLLARQAGGPPWLTGPEVRAVLAVRLRTFLNGDAGVSRALCERLVTVLRDGPLPQVPRTSTGVAGEIIPLAHLGASIVEGYRLGPKEGVALIEGVPIATALALLVAADTRALLDPLHQVVAAEFTLTGAAPDVLDPRLARGDAVLADTVRRLAVTSPRPRSLQPPVSFRASPQVLAHLVRCVGRLEDAVDRALDGVTDSPAYLDESFIGTAGFYGFDLAAHLQSLTTAVVAVTELAVARLHRLMDAAVTGLNAQLSADPGPQTGVSPVHKRAIGVAHRMRRLTVPATVGPVEASGGQEDVQAFAIEAAETARGALAGAVEVLACELLAVHQAHRLGAPIPAAAAELTRGLPSTVEDRPFGRDVELLRARLNDRRPVNR
jgi:histidine ammonia-lyase